MILLAVAWLEIGLLVDRVECHPVGFREPFAVSNQTSSVGSAKRLIPSTVGTSLVLYGCPELPAEVAVNLSAPSEAVVPTLDGPVLVALAKITHPPTQPPADRCTSSQELAPRPGSATH